MQENTHQTLGRNVVPVKYTIEFKPDLATFKFSGNEEISVKISEPTDSILLNAAELAIKEAYLEKDGRSERAQVRLDAEKEQAELRFKDKIGGSAKIRMRFTGSNNDKLYGFYRSRYTMKGREHYLLTTQFEPADARKAFPCFDEPEFKAVFDVSLVVDKALECVSNMPVKETEKLSRGKKRVKFLTTPIMSTYLLYLGVGDFEYVSGAIEKVKLRVLTTRGNKSQARLALGYTQKFIKYFNDYFGIDYPLPKIDFLAIPDFAAGAMENWGAITARESDLLGDESSSVASKQRIAEIVAHELAHMWFGDLVTMRWWDDLWLNESFATLMSFKAMDAVMPEWNMKTQYLEDVVSSALVADQLKATHPISVQVNSPAEISALFDSGISYDKGGSVLRMIEDYVGAEIFRKGLHRYLGKHAYGNAAESDLWKAIDEAAKEDKKFAPTERVASYWIDKPGYPMISVESRGGAYSLVQRRFLISDEEKALSDWPIPIRYTNGETESQSLMSKSAKRIQIDSGKGYLKLNYRQKGFYRVMYEKEMLDKLGEAIKSKELDGTEAWGIENDLFSLARSGRIKVTDYLDFVGRYCFDCDYLANSTILGHLSGLYHLLYSTSLAGITKAPLLVYAQKTLARLGLEKKPDEKSVDTLLRTSAFFALGFLEDGETVKRAVRMFGDHIRKGAALDKDLRSAVYKIVAWTGGPKEYRVLKDHYLEETAIDEKLRFLGTLGFFKETSLIRKSLAFALSKDVRYQDVYYTPVAASSNPFGRELIWNWVSSNWKLLMKRYPPGNHMLDVFISIIGNRYDEKTKKDLESFFSDKSNLRDDVEPELRKTLERIDTNIKFMKANGILEK